MGHRRAPARGGLAADARPRRPAAGDPPARPVPEPVLAAGVAFVYAALAVLATWPVARHPATRLPEVAADSMHISSLLAWEAHALLRPWDLFSPPFFHPFQDSLALSEQLLGASVLGLPVWLATHNAVLVFNAVLLASFPIAGLGTYLLVRDVTRSRLGGIVAGLVFAFSSYRLSRLMHLHVLLTAWMPFVLVALLRFWKTRGTRHAAALAAAVGVQLLSTGHGALTLALVLPFVVAPLAVSDPGPLRDPRFWARGAAAVAVVAAVAVPLVLPYVRVQREHPEFRRGPAEVAYYSSSPTALVTAPPTNRVYGGWMDAAQSTPVAWERWLFPGFAVLGLAVAGAVVAVRRDATRDVSTWSIAFGGLVVFGAVMSLGTTSSLGGVYGLLYRVVPLMTGIRVPGRFAIVTSLGLAGLAGVAVAALRPRAESRSRGDGAAGSASRGRWRYAAVGLAAANLVVAETAVAAPSTYRVPDVPAVYAWLEALPLRGAVLELPTRRAELPFLDAENRREATYLVFLTRHWRPIVNGYSSNAPPSYLRTVAAVQAFPARAAVEHLRRTGVRYVVLHGDALPGTVWADAERDVRRQRPRAVVYDHDAVVVVDVARL